MWSVVEFSAFAWDSGAGQAIDAKKVEFSEAENLNIFKACWWRLDLDARTHRISVVIAAMLRLHGSCFLRL